MPHPALARDNVAVITGAAYGGIGSATALLLATRFHLQLILADISVEGLQRSSDELVKAGVPEEQFTTRVTDVSEPKDVQNLADYVYESKGRCDFLFLNAGVQVPSKSFGGDLEDWDQTFKVNFGGVLNGTQAFVERMVEQASPATVIITGSKQGITNPPGNPAYNASKAAVKSLAESLAHSLLSTSVTVSLLVPGWTWSKLAGGGPEPDLKKRPDAAWTTSQVAEELVARLDEFYIICPDNDVSWPLDAARMQYNLDDILHKRPALSRWNPEYAEAFAKYVEEKVPK